MSFSVIIENELVTNDLIRRFAPFKKRDCKLPDCSINIRNLLSCGNFLSEHEDFYRCFELAYYEKSLLGMKKIGGYQLAPCGDGVLIWDKSIWAWVHDSWKSIDVVLEECMKTSVMLPTLLLRAYQYVALHAGAFLMHSAAIEYQGQGILFCGVPGAGKSTQARLWEQVYQAEPINNDQPCLVFSEGKAYVGGTPWSGKEPCYKCVCFPAKAIVFVEKSMENRIEPISKAEAFGLLFLNEYVVPFFQENADAYEAMLERVIDSIPVYRQYCTKTEVAPRTLRDFFDKQ